MYEKEEEKLTDYKNMYDNIDIPSNRLDDVILAGFNKAKAEEKRKSSRKKWMYSLAAAAIVFIGFFGGIRLSPAFADYIKVIPGMETLVELIRNDKGKILAVEHEYYEEIGVSQEKNGLTFTIDGAIADEKGFVIVYSLHSKEPLKELMVEEVHLESTNGKKLDMDFVSYGRPLSSENGKTSYNDMMEYHFQSPLEARKFELRVKVVGDQTEEYNLRFELKKEIKETKTYVLNKKVTIEGQSITFIDAKIYPLRAAIHVKMDPNNTKRLLNFDDLRLVDEHGEVWNKIADGITASKISEDEAILYLQSNYFKNPEELYLVFNKIQAVDKEDVNVVIDTQHGKILKQPKDNQFTDLVVGEDRVAMRLTMDEEFNYTPLFRAWDKNGNEIEVLENYMKHISDGEEVVMEYGVKFKDLHAEQSPISIELAYYPAWIQGEGKIRIK